MTIDTNTCIYAHIQHIEMSLEEIELLEGCNGFSAGMEEALQDMKHSLRVFREEFAETRKAEKA